MRRSFDTILKLALVAIPVAGCRADRSARAPRTVTDSAGVEVVRVRPPEEWGDPLPVASEIGVPSGAEELELADVAGAIELPDGSVVVANGATDELRVFDADGSFLRAMGGEGEGPGEFLSLDYLGLRGADTVVVYDARLLRLSLLDATGRFLRSYVIADATLPYVVGSLDSGPLVAWQFYGPEPEGVGVYTGQVEFGTVTLPEGRFQAVGVTTAAEEAQVRYRGRVTRAFRAFSREGDVAARGDHIYVLESSANNRIRVHDPGGRLVRVIAVDMARRAPTAEDVSAWVESWMEEFPPPSRDVEEWWRFGFRETEPPDSIPLIRSLEADSDGNVCAERYPLTWDSPGRYWCFSPEGDVVRSFVLPPGQVRRGPHPYWDPQLRITEEGILGVWADELGVERVAVFELPSAGS